MKKSIWRFKRSRYSDPALVRHDLPFICTMATILIVASCQLSRRGDSETMPSGVTEGGLSLAAGGPLRIKPPLTPEDPVPLDPHKMLPIVRTIGAHKHTAYLARVPDCKAPIEQTVVQLHTVIRSDFGAQPVQLTLRGDGLAEAIRADAESFRMSFAVTAPVKASLVKLICGMGPESPQEITPEASIVKETETWLHQIAPDCRELQPVLAVATKDAPNDQNPRDAANWFCQLPEIDPAKAIIELDGIRTTMIRKWSRQPYLLTRRLAVGADLAHSLMAKDPDRKLDVFCRMVKGSLPVELPATIAAKRWQNAVCDHPNENRLSAARFGLAKTVGEISFVRQLFDRTSRLGYLTLRVPMPENSGRDILVTLSPLAEVTDNVARETTRLWLGEDVKGKINYDAESPRSCWHPVYGEDYGLMRLARYLTLSGQTKKVACEETDLSPTDTLAPARYFAESITSETEFVATNGHSKMLRLPIGRYAYKLRALPENLEDWDDASQLAAGSTGDIVWDAKRPRQTITTW